MKSELVLEKRASSSLAQLYVWLSFKTISDISSTMISIVLATYALEVTGSAALLGLTMASRLLGAVAGGAAVGIIFATRPKETPPAGPPQATVEHVIPAGWRF